MLKTILGINIVLNNQLSAEGSSFSDKNRDFFYIEPQLKGCKTVEVTTLSSVSRKIKFS